MTPVPSDPVPEFTLIEMMDGDEEGVVITTIKCVFAPLETRFVHVVFETNHDVPDAAENRVSVWDFDNETERDAYRAAVNELAQAYILPLLSAIPRDTILRFPGGLATYTLSTIEGSVQLTLGMLKSMKDVETRWLQRLPSIDTISGNTPADTIYDIDDIVAVDLLDGGSRDAMLVILRDQPVTRFVAFCIPTAFGCASSSFDRLAEAVMYEMAFLRTIPPHPHILAPPIGYLSRTHDGKRVLCGYLTKYYTGGSLGQPERVDAPIAARVKWAHQIASGLHHLHQVAHTYHGDIKLDNVVLDGHGDAVLIDLEQGRMNEVNAAPELHARSLVSISDDGRLCYCTPHPELDGTGAKGEGEDEDDGIVPLGLRDRPYDIWKDTPRAIEAAEVWAFATALWPLLSDVDSTSAVLALCRSEDPNCRPTFGELEELFRDLNQCQALVVA